MAEAWVGLPIWGFRDGQGRTAEIADRDDDAVTAVPENQPEP
jgi:hypothetical protein